MKLLRFTRHDDGHVEAEPLILPDPESVARSLDVMARRIVRENREALDMLAAYDAEH